MALPRSLTGLLLITVHPDHLARPVLDQIDVAVAVGNQPDQTLAAFARVIGEPAPVVPALLPGSREAAAWRRPAPRAVGIRPVPPRAAHRRHQRKYARGEIAPWNSFYFRGPEGRLRLRAQNLAIFVQISEGVDDETWLYHLRRGDYARWFRDVIKDEDLAREAAQVAANPQLSTAEGKALIRTAIESRYTLPA